jgi:hypothetical protein
MIVYYTTIPRKLHVLSERDKDGLNTDGLFCSVRREERAARFRKEKEELQQAQEERKQVQSSVRQKQTEEQEARKL